MARNVLAYSEIINSSGEQVSPEEFVVILSGSQIKMILAFLESYSLWKSSWEYPTNEQWDILEAFIADTYLRLGGEKVYNIANKLGEINTTLQEMRDKMGSGSGDGSGNTIQDLIFWLKILFAISGGGFAPGTTTPILGQIRDESEAANTKLEAQKVELANIVEKLQGLIDKQCQPLVQSVRLPQDIVDSGFNLIKNGSWVDGDNNGIAGAFYPHYWLVDGNASIGEYPGREFTSGRYLLTINGETACAVRQSAIIPAGYAMPKVIMTWPDGFADDQGLIKVYVNNSEVVQSIVEQSGTYYEADFNATAGDTIKIELLYGQGSISVFGTLELFVYADGITVTQEVTLPSIGGSQGKGRNRLIKPDKRMWETTYDDEEVSAGNWLVDKLEATSDWFGLRLAEVKGVAQELTSTRIFRIDSSTKICNVYFATSMPSPSASNISVDVYNGTAWETVKNCTVTASYAIKVDFPDFVGDKLIRIILNPVSNTNTDGDFWFYDLEIEEID
jgi:hypothetical protein